MIFTDAGAWAAIAMEGDEHHLAASRWYYANRERLFTTDYVVDETLTLLRARGAHRQALIFGARFFARHLAAVHRVTDAEYAAAWEVFRRYDEQGGDGSARAAARIHLRQPLQPIRVGDRVAWDMNRSKGALSIAICVVLGVGAGFVWLRSEANYARNIKPAGIRNVADHFHRFGPPQLIYRIEREGATYYCLSGFPDGKVPTLALPSAPPAYLYDSRGEFLDWCSDPGDGCPGWWEKWQGRNPRVELVAFRKEFGLDQR